jgi:hypothetical protein
MRFAINITATGNGFSIRLYHWKSYRWRMLLRLLQGFDLAVCQFGRRCVLYPLSNQFHKTASIDYRRDFL